MSNINQIVKSLKKSISQIELESIREACEDEAKTRSYLIDPFFEMLNFSRGFGGNLVPEYPADFAHLKGKKVDYAIIYRNKPEIVVEAKKASVKLNDRHLRQLNEYFVYTKEAKIGILTNGVEYQFYTRNEDKDNPGLHPSPFYVFTFEDPDELETLAKFHAKEIDIKKIVEDAQELFFLEGFEKALFKELEEPSKEFVKTIYKRMGGNRMTDKVEMQIRGLINSVSIKNALDSLMTSESNKANSGIITTEDELRVYHMIKAILATNRQIDSNRIGYRDMKGKFSILVDNNQKKKICDLYITPTSQKMQIDSEKIDIHDVDSIVKVKKKLVDRAISLFNS